MSDLVEKDSKTDKTSTGHNSWTMARSENGSAVNVDKLQVWIRSIAVDTKYCVLISLLI